MKPRATPRVLRAVLTCLVLAALPVEISAERMLITTPLLTTPSADAEAFLDAQIVRAIAATGLTAGYEGFSTRVPVDRPDITVTMTTFEEAGSTSIVLAARNATGASENVLYRMGLHEALYRDLAAMLGYLHAVLGPPRPRPRGEVRYFQDFETDFVATGDLPAGSVMQPYSLADRGGNLLLSSASFVLEVDRYFREQAKIGLGADLSGLWAMHLGSTPAGTIVAASATQSGIARLVPDMPTPYRLRTPDTVMRLVVTDDGTVFALDMHQNLTRFAADGVGRIDLGLPEGSFVYHMSAGPENTLLVWDPVQRAILVYDSGGARVDTMFPHISSGVAIGMKGMLSYADGDVLAVFGDRLMRIARTGDVVWELPAEALPEVGGLPAFTEFHLDRDDGTISMLSIQQKRVVQLLDTGMIRSSRELTDTEVAILASNERLRANPYDQQAIADRARIYEEIDAWEAAAHIWDIAYGINPNDRRVVEARAAVTLRRLEENAERLYRQTLELLDRYGVASAAYAYQQAQTQFERLISRAPDNDSARERLQELRDRYEAAKSPQRTPPAVTIERWAIEDLFPSLFSVYQNEQAGTVTIRNTGASSVSRVSLTAEMRFLDFPTPGGSVDLLEPDASIVLPVRLPISPATLRLQESTPVPVRLTVTYEADGRTRETTEVAVITMHRATALTWDDSAKLAAFVTPYDEIVSTFVAPFVGIELDDQPSLSERLFRAARISDAAGTAGIEYVEDPYSGITTVLGNPAIIDTVRFPRTTLRIGYGDCDDTTALLSSLYEAVGIATAVMTSPGHVFLAFDTGEPEANRWLFETDTTAAIGYGGTVWLPYETTILDQGFLASWREGSRLYRRYASAGRTEFIPIAAARDRYPALPLDPPSFTITPPPQQLVAPLYEESLAGLRATLYTGNVARLEAQLRGQDDRRRVRTLNQIGILHGRFNEREEARRAFERAARLDPEAVASYLNLANLALLSERFEEALDWVDEAARRRPAGVLATLIRAQAEYMRGNPAEAAAQMTLLHDQAPDLAAQYPHLSGGEGADRASEARSQTILPWAAEPEQERELEHDRY